MSRGRSHLARLLTVIGEAHDLDEPEPFTTTVLDRLAGALGCEIASYYEVDVTTGEAPAYVWSSYEAAMATWPIPPRSLLTRVELIRLLKSCDQARDGVGTWSDVYTRTARRRFEVSPVEQSALGHVDMAWMVFGDPRSGSRLSWVTLGLSRDFTETQRERFLSARTHVASLIRHADVRRRLVDVMIALDADEGGGASGIVLLGPTLRVERASPAARRIVARWFGRFGSELPEELGDWLRSPFPREPRSIERGGVRLVVETPTRGALILREEHLASGSLTTREREVLSRVADGLSTNEIAHALFVTPATVSKHLEHIYRKLGVTGRTGALAALRRTRTT
jgi:DNA-binding CsgD family transcriptional regulator